ncbi:hypothetical protein [Staphylococcus warneri]|nr:hypothetical protein [Staphylococcus warneri]
MKLECMDRMRSLWMGELGGEKYGMSGMSMNWRLRGDERGSLRGRN